MHGRSNPGTRRLAIVAVLVAAAGIASCGAQSASPTPSTTQPGGTAPPPTAGEPSASALPTPGPSTGETPPTVLLAAGDIGRCDSTHDDATGALVSGLPGVIATLGDTAYEDGTSAELNDCFGGSWGAVKDRVRFAVTGNHDIHTDGGAPTGGVHGRRGRAGRAHVVLRRPRVVARDRARRELRPARANVQAAGPTRRRGCEATSRRAMPGARSRCSTSRSSAVASTAMTPRVRPLWDALYAGNVDLVLDGHDHDYERFAPQDPGGAADASRGIVEIIAGTGGAELEAFKDPRPNSLVRINDTYGVLELTLLADSWSSRFVGVDGSVPDQAAGPCH